MAEIRSIEADSAPAALAAADVDYADLRRRLEGVLRRMCPAWLADRREDLLQVALLRVMEISRKSEKPRQFSSSYLWRAAQSAMIDEIRRLRRRREVALEEVAGADGPAFRAPHPDPERQATGRALGRQVWGCIGQLIRPRRLAVLLHLEGYAPEEAAKLMGWNMKKNYNLVHRGMEDLRSCLRTKGLSA